MIPIGDSPKARRTPYVTWALILLNFAVFIRIVTLSDTVAPVRSVAQRQFDEQTETVCYGFEAAPTARQEFYCRWSYQPQEWLDAARDELSLPGLNRTEILFSIVTSVFLHAGWLHIIGNMVFLWVFGDNVEDRLGHVVYLLFYLLAGLAAAFAQTAIDTSSVVPNVGASGAIAGVLGAYLLFYPRAMVRVIIPFFPLIFIPIPLPAVVMILLWFAQNLLSGIATLGSVGAADGGVAFFAHVGGFVFGFVVALLWRLAFSAGDRGAPRWEPRR